MKIVLKNGEEMSVIRISRNIDANTDMEQFMLTFKNVSLEEVAEKLTSETCGQITLKRDGGEDVLYSGYTIQNITENISDEMESIMASLTKEIGI